jgi:tetratricopeptide (TPR) repeat protein
MLYINTSQIDKAIINQESIVAFDTTNTYNRFQLSLLYSEAKRFDDAIKEINKLESSVGFSPNLSETKTRIFFETNSSEQAKEEIDKLLDFNPNHPLYLLYGSDVDFREGKDSLAFAKIYRAIEIDPSFTLGYVELYQRYIDVGNHLNALNVLKILFTEHSIPDNELVRLFYPILFEQYYYTQHSQFLDSLIDIGLQKFPSSLSLNELAYEHYLRRQDFAKARLYLDKLVKIDENNPIRWERLINFDYSVGVKEMVVFNSIKAINLFPDNYIFYIFNSISLGDINDFQGAINVLVKGTSKVTNPNHVSELYGSIGDFYFRLNDLKSSFKAYRKSLQHNPNNARVLNNYSYYLAINEMNLSKALDMSSKAVELEPNNSTYIDTKGWVLFTMKRYEEARDVLRNAIAKSGSTSAVINEHYGDALYQTGNKENAYIYWLKAKEIGGGSPKLEIKIRDKAYVP